MSDKNTSALFFSIIRLFIKCPCASKRRELLWRLCREFPSKSELQSALHPEGVEEVGEVWREEEEVEEVVVEVTQERNNLLSLPFLPEFVLQGFPPHLELLKVS